MELLDVIARWVHVIAGTMWVGNSLLFNWLDRNLVAPRPDDASRTGGQGSFGTIWLLHSGAFYHIEKSLLAGQRVPAPLHWFKWQAYTTWLSGAALLVVVYYAGGRAVLGDASLAPLTHWGAVAVGAGAIVAGWALYECMNRMVAPRAPRLAVAVWLSGLVAIAVALTLLLSGRAAFLHVGAMLGTIMAANVFFTIVPSQRELVSSVGGGRATEASTVSARAKRVSIHNNYFTFPVIVLMVSSHFPAAYGAPHNWLFLLVLVACGASVRHVLNIRFTTAAWKPVLGAVIAASAMAMFAILRMDTAPAPAADAMSSAPVTFAEARHVIDKRCSACHSAHPSDLTYGAAPAGVKYDTPEQIAALALRIRERAVVTRTMPPGNKTRITDEERALLGRWVAQGAVVR
jgi:uncharacterized membrane protein